MSFQVKQWLSQGIAAAKAGDTERAKDLLLQVVDADEYNEQAWLWLSSVVDGDADREVCLENVLAINPENNLAKAGLVHLRRRRAPAPPLRPEPPPPVPKPKPSVPQEHPQTAPPDWLSPSQPAEADALLDARLAATAPVFGEVELDAPAEKKPKRKRRRRRLRRLARGVVAMAFFGLVLLAVGVVALYVIRARPLDAAGRDYAAAMRPVLADYDAWWAGSYGALIGEMTDYCGPSADGWRNRDVLLNCSRYPSVDCAHLAAHCGSDIDAMRERIGELSQEARKAARSLLADLDAITPPQDIAVSHARFRACLQAQMADATRAGELAHGEGLTEPDYLPACQMFSQAEEEVRDYVDIW